MPLPGRVLVLLQLAVNSVKEMEKFRALGLSDNVLEALEKKGFETPTEIQEKTIPLLLGGEKDIVGQAATGTGKTAAFGLPLIEKLDDNSKAVQALILCPTRELALQVAEEIISFKGAKRLFVQAIYGGQSYNVQIAALRKGVQIVVGTPGRVRDHIEKGTLKLGAVTHVVLDEADEMLNMGFEEEVREILKSVPEQRRMLLFSATMPPQILKLAKTFMKDYDLVEVAKKQVTTEMVDQSYFEVKDSDRFTTLCRIIDTEPEFYGIVFCRTKAETDEIASKLLELGYDAEAIHGDITQSQRELILKKFKLRKITILVATDVAARGIDVNDLTHVINYNLPQDPESYVHRIGRTGRAGKFGTAITIVSPRERRELLFIERLTKAPIRRENVPSIADVIETKTMKLKTEMAGIIEKGEHEEYLELARELLEQGNMPEQVLAGVMKYALKDALVESSYREIGQVQESHKGGQDMARLFVARGHEDGMNAGKIAQFLAGETGVDKNALHDIRVFDKFSFITVSPGDAEMILAVFSKVKGRQKPLVTRAKDKPQGGQGGAKGRPERSEGFHKPRESFSGAPGRQERSQKSFHTKGGHTESSHGRDKGLGGNAPAGREKEINDGSKFIPKKRNNKMTDYLDKGDPALDTNKPVKENQRKDNFKIDFKDDDLNW